MTRSIFSEPNAHDVEHISADLRTGDRVACLALKLQGKSPFIGQREGEFEIFGPLAMAPRFARLAEAINAIFGGAPDV